MSRLFVIENELHAEHQSEYATLAEAQAELERRAALLWDQEPKPVPAHELANVPAARPDPRAR